MNGFDGEVIITPIQLVPAYDVFLQVEPITKVGNWLQVGNQTKLNLSEKRYSNQNGDSYDVCLDQKYIL